MLFARRAQSTRRRLATLFGLVDGSTHDLSFLPHEQEKLYTEACAALTKQSLDWHTLLTVTTSIGPFIAYHHREKSSSSSSSSTVPSSSSAEETEATEATADASTDVRHQLLFEAKLYLLCLVAIAQNQAVCDGLLPLASTIQHHHREWALREDRPFWYLYEKTPWYWLNYLVLRPGELPHPQIELREKLRHLRALEKNTFAFIGVGSRILSRYEAIGRTNLSERLLNLVHKNQLLFQRFFAIPDRDQAQREAEQEHRRRDGQTGAAATEREHLRLHSVLRSLSRSHVPLGEDEAEPEDEDGDEGHEDLLYNLAQGIDLSHFDYHSSDFVLAGSDEASSSSSSSSSVVPNIANVYAQLVANVSQAATFRGRMRDTLGAYRRPSALATSWLKYSLIAAGVGLGVVTITRRRADIVAWITDFRVLASNFLHKNVLLPLQDVYETIRYEKRAFTIMDARALDADVESLQRMVDEFVRKTNPQIDEARLAAITEAAANSDISTIMPVYERELEAPIKNALFGDLLSLLLIQVHKAKVDVARAMLALDKLMRANELNFQLFAVTPALLLLGGVSRYFYRQLTHIDVRRTIHQQIRETLRHVERLLDLASGPAWASMSSRPAASGAPPSLTTSFSGWRHGSSLAVPTHGGGAKHESDLRLEETGRLLVAINDLISLALQMPRHERKWLLEDLQDLQSEELQVGQKLATIHRMYHSHRFLTAV